MSKFTARTIIYFLGYVSVIAIDVVTVLGKLIPSIGGVCRNISLGLGIVVCSLVGLYHALTKRNKLYLIILVVAIVVIVVFYLILR